MPSACVCCSFCCTFAAVLLLAANKRSRIYLSRVPPYGTSIDIHKYLNRIPMNTLAQQPDTSRNTVLDIMKGLGILLIIYEHCYAIDIEFKRWTMSFVMPMFFLVSGYLYHPEENRWKHLQKETARLVLPYIAGVTILAFVHFFVRHDLTWMGWVKWLVSAAGTNDYFCHYLPHWNSSVGAFWFFMALFWCRVIFNAVYTFAGKWKYIVLTLLATLGYLSLRFLIRLPLCISEGLSVMVFFLVGHLFRNAQTRYNQSTETTRHHYDLFGTIVLLLLFVLWCWTLKNSEMVCGMGYYKHHLLNILAACGMTYIYYWFCRGIAINLPATARLLTFAGHGSLFLLWIHKLSLHTVFFGLSVFGIPLPPMPLYIAFFLISQWVLCLACQLIVSQSDILSHFFGIYRPKQV